MSNNVVAGTLSITTNGTIINIVAGVTFNLGLPKSESLVGADRMHGFKTTPQAPFIKGEARDSDSLDIVNDILKVKDATIVLEVASGKTYMFNKARYTGDGDIETEDGKIQFEFGAMSATPI